MYLPKKKILAREMSFRVSWVDAAPVEGAVVSCEGREWQLHPSHARRSDCVPGAVLEGSASSG